MNQKHFWGAVWCLWIVFAWVTGLFLAPSSANATPKLEKDTVIYGGDWSRKMTEMQFYSFFLLWANDRNHLPANQLAINFPARKDLEVPPKKRRGLRVSVN